MRKFRFYVGMFAPTLGMPRQRWNNSLKGKNLRKRPPSSHITHRVGEWRQWDDKRSKSFVAAITAEKGKETLLKPNNTGHLRHTYYLGIRDILSSWHVLQHQQKSIVKRHIDVDLQAINGS